MSLDSCHTLTPTASPSSAPIPIGYSPTDASPTARQDVLAPIAPSPRPVNVNNNYDRSAAPTPGWPYASAMRRHSIERPSAYVSDAELLGVADLDDVPFMSEPPPPPRPAEVWLARPLLPPAASQPRRRTPPSRKARSDVRSASKK